MVQLPTSIRVAACFTLLVAPIDSAPAQAKASDPCPLLATAEVAGITGWTPAGPKAETYGSITTVTPVEDLGAPAIRSDDGLGPLTVEAAVNGRLLGVTAPNFEAAQALARTAISRLR